MVFKKTQSASTRFKIEDVDKNIVLGYSEFKVEQVINKLVDEAEVSLAPNTDIEVGDEIVITDTSQNSKVFGGYVTNIDEGNDGWTLECVEYVTELVGKQVKKVYEEVSPDSLLNDLISNETSFSFSSNSTTSFSIDKHVVDGPVINAVEDVRDVLNWIIRTDPDKNMVLEERGTTKSGVVFTHGENCLLRNWKSDDSKLINTVELEGGKTEYQQIDTFAGDGSQTEFGLTNNPVGNVKVLVDGTEKEGGIAEQLSSGDDFYIDQDAPKIVFASAPSNSSSIEVQYTYEVPIVVQAQASDAKVAPSRREISTTIKREWIKTFSDARQYASKYVENHSQPSRTAEVEARYKPSPKVGRLARVVDESKGVDEKFIVEKKTIKHNGRMELEIGTPKHNAIDWRHQVQRRIKELQQTKKTEKTVNVYRSFQNNLNISMDIQVEAYERIVNDSFVIGHSENGVVDSPGDGKDRMVIDSFSDI